MGQAESVTKILNSSLRSIKEVVPLNVVHGKPSMIADPLQHIGLGALIGVTGDLKGKLIFQTSDDVLKKIALQSYGMEVEGELLASLLGETANMIAGKTATLASTDGIIIDITPPTVLNGQTDIYGISKSIRVPFSVDGSNNSSLILALEEKGAS